MSDGQVASLVARKATALQELLRDERVLPGRGGVHPGRAEEVPIAIASGALRHEIPDILEEAGLGGLFATVVAAGDTLHSKPSPAPPGLHSSSWSAVPAISTRGDVLPLKTLTGGSNRREARASVVSPSPPATVAKSCAAPSSSSTTSAS